MNAVRLSDGQIHLYGETWSSVFPASRLGDWIAFYDRMAKKYGRDYAATSEVLRRVQ